METTPGYAPVEEYRPFKEPDPVLVTPCDPWPRPYYLENGLRRVAPYHFTYNTFCKERWRGRELMDIFASEFRDRPEAYYVSKLRGVSGAQLLTSPERCYRKGNGCCEWQGCSVTSAYN